MTVVSSKEFVTNQEKYFDLAVTEQVYVKKGANLFVVINANEFDEPNEYFEPDEDYYRSISIDELSVRVKKGIHQFYETKNESNSTA